jgi:putative ABC transport system permease protein
MQSDRARSGRPGRIAYRALLLFYPAPFRKRHGGEMARLFAEKRNDARARAGRPAVAVLWMRAVWDAARNGLGERMEGTTRRRRRRGTPMGNTQPDGRGGGGMDALIKDVRYAARTLFRNPGFAVVATLTIALGVGANTAIFSVVRAVLLQPLPYEEPNELVLLWGEMRTRGVTHFPSSPPDFADYRRQADLLDDLAGVFTFPVSVTGDGDPVQIDAGGVTTNFFDVLGVEPILGRTFVESDGAPDPAGLQPGAPGAQPGYAVLSHALWQQRYGGSAEVVGRTIEVGGAPTEIVGVMPPGFVLLLPPTAYVTPDVDLWLAARIDYENAPRSNVFLRPIGRMRDGATAAQLQAQVDRISQTLAADDPVKSTAGYSMRVEELRADLTAGVRPVLLSLFGAVAFVLLIACANVSNLLLVRASGRDRELAVRAAMGGSRGRLIRQMLIESGLLALAGAVVGVALAAGGVGLLLSLQPADLPRIETARIDGLVLTFTVVTAAGAALLFGVVPALQTSRVELVDALKARGPVSAHGARKVLRNGVVISEVALSLVLLIGSGLMVRSFVELAGVSPGFEPSGVVTFTATPPFARYPQPADRASFSAELQRRLEAIPGVERAATAVPLPLDGNLFNGRYGPEEALSDPEAFGQATYRGVLPGYFEAMGTRLLSGRVFTDADLADSAAVVVVDEQLAGMLWPGQSAIGRRFLVRVTSPEPELVEVVGVVEHQRSESLGAIGMETVYFTDRYIGAFGGTWVVKASVDPLGLVSTIRDEVAAIDPDIPVADVRLMQSYLDQAMGPTRFALTVITVFGLIALVLASVGLYGVLSFAVRSRTAEIGVRMAFGAESGGILRLVVGQGLALAGAGILVGLLMALPVTRVMESLLVGVTPTDPLTFVAISVIFATVATFASYLPARRATRIDPVTALREE